MKKTEQGGGELKRNRNRQQSKESDCMYFVATPSMHGIAAITGNMHRSLRYFMLLEHITSSAKRAKRAELTL